MLQPSYDRNMLTHPNEWFNNCLLCDAQVVTPQPLLVLKQKNCMCVSVTRASEPNIVIVSIYVFVIYTLTDSFLVRCVVVMPVYCCELKRECPGC